MPDSATGTRSFSAPSASRDGALPTALAALVVHDSDDDAEFIASVLHRAGYLPVRWRRVADLVEMQVSLAEESWDVVLCDHQMSAFDSFNALAVLGASGRDIPLILVSSAIGEETAVAAIHAGAADFVSKDRLDRLGAAVRTSIRQFEELRAQQAEHARLAAIVRSSNDAIVSVDAESHVTSWNSAAEALYGYSAGEVLGYSSELLGPADATPASRAADRPPAASSGLRRYATQRLCKDGALVDVAITAFPLLDAAGNVCGAASIERQITEGKLGEVLAASKAQELELRATEDFLAALTDSMAEGMFAMNGDGRVTYMNRSAERLLGWTNGELAVESIHGTPRRQNDDGTPYSAEECPVLSALQTGTSVRIDDSAFARRDGRLLPVAYSAAPVSVGDDAHGTVVVFSDVTARRAEEQRREGELETLNWIGRIRDALDEHRLVLHAQPIIDLPSRQVATYELLVRIVDRDGAMIAPSRFLPAAEQFGLIEEIDGWVLDEATHLAALGVKVHFNISGRSLGSRALIGALTRVLRDTGADPALLVCEITETALANDEGVAEAFVHELAQLGCGIALDDFGVGYGGFAYLKKLPVTVLKIDREFVNDLLDSPKNQHIVKAIANLAKGFGRTTIAEGVEIEDTIALLEGYGVDCAQGFALGRPRPIDTLLTGTALEELRARVPALGASLHEARERP